MDKADIVFGIFAVIMNIPAVLLLASSIHSYYTTETVTIQGEVTDVEPIINDNGNIEYLQVTFDNGDTYDIKYYYEGTGSTIDFTVNSKIIIEMHKPNHFIFPLTDENKYWKINRLVKAP